MSDAEETEEGRRWRLPLATLEQRILATLKLAGKPLTDLDLATRLRVTMQAVRQASHDLAAVGKVKRLEDPQRGAVTRLAGK
jgi:DNA-binding GntR family transcriptional regulator